MTQTFNLIARIADYAPKKDRRALRAIIDKLPSDIDVYDEMDLLKASCPKPSLFLQEHFPHHMDRVHRNMQLSCGLLHPHALSSSGLLALGEGRGQASPRMTLAGSRAVSQINWKTL